jgi:hypothetical protein
MRAALGPAAGRRSHSLRSRRAKRRIAEVAATVLGGGRDRVVSR